MQNMTESKKRQPYCVAVIGDVIGSKERKSAERELLQQSIQETLQDLNERYKQEILAKFTITIGDEFQVLLKAATPIPEIIRTFNFEICSAQIRWGIGWGKLSTSRSEYAVGMDGPVFHKARKAIETAKKESLLGGVFAGFKAPYNDILNGLGRILWHNYSRMKPAQFETVRLVRTLPNQNAVASERGVTPSAVSDALAAVGWESIAEAERGWHAALSQFDYIAKWNEHIHAA